MATEAGSALGGSDAATPATPPAAATPAASATPAAAAPAAAAPSKDSAPAAAAGDKPTDQGGQGTKPAEGEKPKGTETAPADIEVKLPEGVEADAGLMDAFKAKAKELGLDSAKAQGLVDVYVKALTDSSQRQAQAAAQRSEAWMGEVKADKELGGANLQASLAAARKAVQWAGGDELRQAIDELGIGNHPRLFRAFARFGQALAEDSIKVGGANPGAPASTDPDTALKRMYPSMYPKDQ